MFVYFNIFRPFSIFKNELDEGQATKKRAVIRLIQLNQSSRAKLFQKWEIFTMTAKIVDKNRQT